MKKLTTEEAKARAWLRAHRNDPLVAGAGLPRDTYRDRHTGETLARQHAETFVGGRELSTVKGRPHRAEVSYSKFPRGAADWERAQVPDSYVPLVSRSGLDPRQLDKRIRVERAMRQLQAHQRDLLAMRYYEELTLEEIAAETGVTYQAVQQRLATAVQDFVRAVGETWSLPYELLKEALG